MRKVQISRCSQVIAGVIFLTSPATALSHIGGGRRRAGPRGLAALHLRQYRLSHYFALDVQLAACPAASVDPAGSRFLPARRSRPLTHRGHVFILRPPHCSLCYLLASPTLSRFQPVEAILADIDLISVASLLACHKCFASRDVFVRVFT